MNNIQVPEQHLKHMFKPFSKAEFGLLQRDGTNCFMLCLARAYELTDHIAKCNNSLHPASVEKYNKIIDLMRTAVVMTLYLKKVDFLMHGVAHDQIEEVKNQENESTSPVVSVNQDNLQSSDSAELESRVEIQNNKSSVDVSSLEANEQAISNEEDKQNVNIETNDQDKLKVNSGEFDAENRAISFYANKLTLYVDDAEN